MYYLLKLHSQTDKISLVGPCHLPKILGQKAEATTEVTLRTTNDFCVRLKFLSILSVVYYFDRKHFAGELAENMLVRFIFNGRELRHDASTLQSCNITDGSVIHCLLTRAAQQEENTEQQQQVMFEGTTAQKCKLCGAVYFPLFWLVTAHNEVAARLMFSQAFVIPSVHGGLPRGVPASRGVCLGGSTSSGGWADPPSSDTMRYGQWTSSTHPTGIHSYLLLFYP